jgi:hypothetical protein
MGRLILAESDSTIHVKIGEPTKLDNGEIFQPHESRMLFAGQTIDPSEVPEYLLDLAKQGKAPGLTLLTEAQAKKIQREAAIARGELEVLQEIEEELAVEA